jgi:HPr kinase/phosphorylase
MAETPRLTVDAFVAQARAAGVELSVLGGEAGLGGHLASAALQKTGLALAGFERFLRPDRLLVFGESEVSYLVLLPPAERVAALRRVLGSELPAVLVTGALELPEEAAAEADRAGVPLLRTPLATPVAISRLTALLEDRLAPREIVHGVLLDILGLGVLVVGESGIGKSECGLDLVVRGHRLVADDAVEIRRRAESIVIGTCPELTRHHMEVRGIGVINIREMFGVSSTRSSKRVELVVQLERWDTALDYERLGLDDTFHQLLGVPVPLVRIPVAPGRNVSILVEVAARNRLLRARGRHAARALADAADARLALDDAADGPDPEELGDAEEDT